MIARKTFRTEPVGGKKLDPSEASVHPFVNQAEGAAEQLGIFAACLFDPADLVEIRRLPSGRSTWHVASELPQLAATLTTDNATENIHIGVNPRTKRGGRSADDVARARCIFADFDAITVADAVAKCAALGLPTRTLTVSSGHGCHVYLRLDEPLTDLDTWTRFQKDFADAVGSDPAIHDPPRLMRLPGFRNHKEPAASCCVVDADPGRVFELAELAEVIPERPEVRTSPAPVVSRGALSVSPSRKLARATADAATWESVAEPGRNNAAMRNAARLAIDFDLSDEQSWLILCTWNSTNTPPLDERELRRCLASGRKSGNRTPGCALNRRQMTLARIGTDTLPAGDTTHWQTLADIASLPTFRQGLQPVSTGYSSIDAILGGGLRPESLYVLAGRTGSAKSTLALNIVRLAALNGTTSLLFKLEESTTEATWRILAAASQVNMSVFMDGARSIEAHQAEVDDGLDLLRDLPIRISDHRDLDGIARISREHLDAGGKLIVLDQMSMVSVPDPLGSYERATLVSNTLRLLARQLRIPILAVAQVNRGAAQKKRGELEAHDLRDSGAIENDAAAVLMLDRSPVDKCRVAESPYSLELHVKKNRYGRITETDNPISLTWWPWFCRIEEAVRVGGAT